MGKTAGLGTGIVANDLTIAQQPPLVDEQALHAHGTAGVDFIGADAHLCPETESEAIAESGAAIPEHIGRIHPVHKRQGVIAIGGDDHISMSGPITVDMIDGLGHIGRHLDGNNQVQIFGRPIPSTAWATSIKDRARSHPRISTPFPSRAVFRRGNSAGAAFS